MAGLIFNRKWAMPSKSTFTIGPIKRLLNEEIPHGSKVIDPFCGWNSPATIKNDLNPDIKADYHMDAIEFLKLFKDGEIDCVLLDPPYSPTQIAEHYKIIGNPDGPKTTQNGKILKLVKNEIARITHPGSIVISCGWNSSGMGKIRGFKFRRFLLVAHGGGRNDTIVTVEKKEQTTLQEF